MWVLDITDKSKPDFSIFEEKMMMIELLDWVNDITITELFSICKKMGVEDCRISVMGLSEFGLFKDKDVIILDDSLILE